MEADLPHWLFCMRSRLTSCFLNLNYFRSTPPYLGILIFYMEFYNPLYLIFHFFQKKSIFKGYGMFLWLAGLVKNFVRNCSYELLLSENELSWHCLNMNAEYFLGLWNFGPHLNNCRFVKDCSSPHKSASIEANDLCALENIDFIYFEHFERCLMFYWNLSWFGRWSFFLHPPESLKSADCCSFLSSSTSPPHLDYKKSFWLHLWHPSKLGLEH